MAEITELSKQFLNIEGHGIDAALEPVENYSGLTSIAIKSRYVGMEKVVLNKENGQTYPMKFFLSGSTRNTGWKIKQIFPLKDYATLKNILTLVPSISAKSYMVGLEATVIADETNDNRPTKYWITAIDTDSNTLTWERCNGSGVSNGVTVDGDDQESESGQTV